MMPARAGRDPVRRRCIVARTAEDRQGLVRFVANGAEVVPDLAERLPGRGAWVGARRARIDEAVRCNLFAAAFRRRIDAPGNLAGQVEELVARRIVDAVGLARRAGRAVHGRDRCLEALHTGSAMLLVVAEDAGSQAARMRQAAHAQGAAVGIGPRKAMLGAPFGGAAAYLAIGAGPLCGRIERDLQRLAGLRPVRHGNQA